MWGCRVTKLASESGAMRFPPTRLASGSIAPKGVGFPRNPRAQRIKKAAPQMRGRGRLTGAFVAGTQLGTRGYE